MTSLITTLPATVNNPKLEPLGAIRIDVKRVDNPSANSQSIRIGCMNTPKIVKVFGAGAYIENTYGSGSGTQEFVVNPSSSTLYYNTFYVSNVDCTLYIYDKYTDIHMIQIGGGYSDADASSCSIDVGRLGYVEGLVRISLNFANAYGNMTQVMEKIKDRTKLEYIYARGGTYELDIASLRNFENLKTIGLESKNVFGDLSLLNGNYSQVSINECGYVAGDIANINTDSFRLFGMPDNGTTWTERDKTKKVLNINYLDMGGSRNIDHILIDNSQCVAPDTGFTISLVGQRTSASDEAVRLLNSKGVTVRVNGVIVNV